MAADGTTPGRNVPAGSDDLESIPAEEDRELILEAERCRRAGALRAGFIMTWVAAVESLRRRFIELAPRDDEARKVARKIEELEGQHRSIDAYVVESAHTYGFLDEIERTKLDHLLEMRHVYAHPYSQTPSDTEVRAAMEQVTHLVLEKPLKLRHAFVSRQVEVLTTRAGWIDDVEERVVQYGKDVAGRIDETLKEYAFEKLAAVADELAPDPNRERFLIRASWFSRGLIDEMGMPSDTQVESLVERFPLGAGSLFTHSGQWRLLGERAREILLGHLVEHAQTDSRQLIAAIGLWDAELEEREREKLTELFGEARLNSLVNANAPLRLYETRIERGLRSVTYTAERRGHYAAYVRRRASA